MTPTQPTRVTPRPFGPRPPLGGRNRLRPLVAQPIHGLVIAPHVADRAPLADEPTPICASVEEDLHLSFDQLTEPRATHRPRLRALEHSDALDVPEESEAAPIDVADPVITPDPDIEQPETDGEPESTPEPETQPGSGDDEEPIAPQPDTDTADTADTDETPDRADEAEPQDDPEPPASA